MLRRRRQPGAAGGRDRQGHGCRPAEHVLELGRLIGDLVGCHEHEVHEHQVDDRPQAGDGGTDAKADDRLLADRRVDGPALAELFLDSVEGVEHPAVGADVLAGDEHVGIGIHLQAHGLGERLHVRQ